MTSGTTRTGRPARNRMAPGSTKSRTLRPVRVGPTRITSAALCLPRHKLGRQFKSGAPFHLLEMLALNAELLAHLLEAGRRHAIVVRGGFAVDHNASGGEGRPQGQARDSNERCLKPVRQIERELDSLFAIALDVDVDHYRCNGHRLFPVVPGSLLHPSPRDHDPSQRSLPLQRLGFQRS